MGRLRAHVAAKWPWLDRRTLVMVVVNGMTWTWLTVWSLWGAHSDWWWLASLAYALTGVAVAYGTLRLAKLHHTYEQAKREMDWARDEYHKMMAEQRGQSRADYDAEFEARYEQFKRHMLN